MLVDEPAATGAGDPEVASVVGEVYAEIGRLPAHLREVVAAVDVAGLHLRRGRRGAADPATGPS